MITHVEKAKHSLTYRIFAVFTIFIFMTNIVLAPTPASAQMVAQDVLNLPAPGTMVTTSQGYNPPVLRGVVVSPDNPLQFDFILDQGDEKLDIDDVKPVSQKLIKYFLAAITVPEDELWVNLSPYEEDRIISEKFGQTEMGRDLLAQDYILKQIAASLIYPEDALGKKFWDRVYQKAQELYGTTEIPLNTFNKVWIVPDEAVVFERGYSAVVLKSHLKVMLEEDYLALEENMHNGERGTADLNEEDVQVISGVTSEVVREVLLPELEKEVNEGKTFAPLRQVFHSLVLATWFKNNLRETLLGQVYADQNKIQGVDIEDKNAKDKIYDQYVEALKKGVFDYIKEDRDPVTRRPIHRKYFSGGVVGNFAVLDSFREVREMPQADRASLESARNVFYRVRANAAEVPAEVKADLHNLAVDKVIADSHDETKGYVKAEKVDEGYLGAYPEARVRTEEAKRLLKAMQSQGILGAEEMLTVLDNMVKGQGAYELHAVRSDGSGLLEAVLGDFRMGGHSSDRGIHLFEWNALLHELVAFAGMQHEESVAFDVLLDAWRLAPGTRIQDLLRQAEVQAEFARRLSEQGLGQWAEAKNILETVWQASENIQRNLYERSPHLLRDLAIKERDILKPAKPASSVRELIEEVEALPKLAVVQDGRLYMPRPGLNAYDLKDGLYPPLSPEYVRTIQRIREETGITNEEVLRRMVEAEQKGIELGVDGSLRAVDGAKGSTNDLPPAQQLYVAKSESTLGRKVSSFNELPTTAFIASGIRAVFKVSRASQPDVIEYVAPQKGIKTPKVMRVGDVQNFLETEDKRFVGRGGEKYVYAVYHILHDIFGLTGVKIEMAPIDPMAEAGGMESSNAFLTALVGIGSILSGVNLTDSEIFNLAVKLEDYEAGGLTGGQGNFAFLHGGAGRIIWTSGITDKAGRLVNPYSAIIIPFLSESQLDDYSAHAVLLQLGIEYENGNKKVPRTANEINQMWMGLTELNHPQADLYHLSTIPIAVEAILAEQVGDYAKSGQMHNYYVDIRNSWVRMWLDAALKGRQVIEREKRGEVIPAGEQIDALTRAIAMRTFYDAMAKSNFRVVNFFMERGQTIKTGGVQQTLSGEQYLGRESTVLYVDDAAMEIVMAAREAGIYIMPLGAGGPGANMVAFSAQGRDYIARWLKDNYNIGPIDSAQAKQVVDSGNGYLQGWVPLTTSTKPANWFGFRELGFSTPQAPQPRQITLADVGLNSGLVVRPEAGETDAGGRKREEGEQPGQPSGPQRGEGEDLGGIDLNPANFTLQIRRDEEGRPLPIRQQPIPEMNINGFIPVIINVIPMTNLDFILGERSAGEAEGDLSFRLSPFDRQSGWEDPDVVS